MVTRPSANRSNSGPSARGTDAANCSNFVNSGFLFFVIFGFKLLINSLEYTIKEPEIFGKVSLSISAAERIEGNA